MNRKLSQQRNKHLHLDDLNNLLEETPDLGTRAWKALTIFILLIITGLTLIFTTGLPAVSLIVNGPQDNVRQTATSRETITLFRSLPVGLPEEKHYSIVYSTSVHTVEDMFDELQSIIPTAIENDYEEIDFTVRMSENTFHYDGYKPEDLNSRQQLNEAYKFLLSSSTIPGSTESSLSSVFLEEEGMRRTTIESNYYGVEIQPDRVSQILQQSVSHLTRNGQFENHSFSVKAKVDSEITIPVTYEIELNSLEDTTSALTVIPGYVFEALQDLNSNRWTFPLVEATFVNNADPALALLDVVVNSGDNAIVAAEMRGYWFGLPQVLRPQPYLVNVYPNEEKSVTVFAIRR